MFRRLCRRNSLTGGVSGATFLLALCLPSVVVVFLLLSANDSYTLVDEEKQELNDRIADLRGQIDHIRMIDQAKRKAFFDLQRQFQWIFEAAERANISRWLLANLTQHQKALMQGGRMVDSPVVNGDLSRTNDLLRRQRLLANLSSVSANADLSVPNMFDHLPHLLQSPTDALVPAVRVANGHRRGVHLVIGIPTIKRPKVSYLVTTLRSLTDNLSADERQEVLIVVFIAELSGLSEWASEQILLLQSEFPELIQAGLLEIVVPTPNFYPDLNTVTPTFDDKPERMFWRTKQNLDYAYLMMYCQARGRFYMQLEDDVVTKPGYYQTVKDFILKQSAVDWFLLEFSSLGFIGKLFKTVDLPKMVDFLLMFYKDKPVDWLLDNILYVKLCHPEKSPKVCQETKNKFRIRLKPSLFQHVGTHSSLKGKIQKLKEKDFGKATLHRPHGNPPAVVTTSLKTYQKYTLEAAYAGDNFFWGLLPQPGDWVKFEFSPKIRLSGVVLRSGNSEHPDDQLFNTSVEVQPDSHADLLALSGDKTDDGYVILGWFSPTGSALISLNQTAVVKAVRLVVHTESANWAILSEIWIRTSDNNTTVGKTPVLTANSEALTKLQLR